MEAVIVLDTRPTQLTTWSERKYMGEETEVQIHTPCMQTAQWHLTMRHMNRDYVPHGNKT